MLAPELAIALAVLLGLAVGSFLNVVIHRLPRMMERQWAAECAQRANPAAPADTPFNLMVPRSHCPQCGRAIRWHENVPVLGYLRLRGRCAGCGTAISARYPLVELGTALLFGYCAWRWGLAPAGLAWAGFAAALLTLGLIDWDTTLLPDDITLPLLWGGLVAGSLGWSGTPPEAALWGAVAGYLSLWLVYWGFRLLTGKEGMGYGDFKLFAALGAWFGWPALIPIILMASAIGAVAGIAMKLGGQLREGGYVPFGPFLAAAGLTAMLFGPQAMLGAVGL